MLNTDSKPSLKLEAIKEGLQKRGYYVWRQSVSDEEYLDIAGKLGTVFRTTDVRVEPNGQWGVKRPEQFAFHTDHPGANFISWRCMREDEGGNAPTLLIDTTEVLATFTQDELLELENVKVPYLVGDLITPLLSRKEDGSSAFYYIRHLIPQPAAGTAAAHVLTKLTDLIATKELDSVIEVSLREGECLFIDNNRMLHGRNALLPTSVRHLKRLWISTGKLIPV